MTARRCATKRSPEPVRSRGVRDGGDEFATEVGDVLDHSAPDDVAVAEGGFVDPDRTGVHEIVLDPQAPGGALPVDDAGRDPDEAGVADQADDLALVVCLADQVLHGVVPAKL